MEVEISALSIIIEFAVGLAGFSGVVVVFTAGPDRWSAIDRYRILNLLMCSLVAALVAFFAIGLVFMDYPPATVWRGASAFAFVCFVSIAAMAIRGRMTLPRDQKDLINPFIFWPLTIGAMAATIAQLLNFLALLPGKPFIWLYYGIVFMLVVSGMQFIRMIFTRP